METNTRRQPANTQKRKLRLALEELATGSGSEWTSQMETSIPSRWERHGDLVLFPVDTLRHSDWQAIRDAVGSDTFWRQVAIALSAQRVAVREGAIVADSYRRPRILLLLGNDGLVTHIDNGIKYIYDVTKCMFSAGNITEKLRIAKMQCQGEVVVDLYAGIGYFTLPFLVHAGAKYVHACEWNPDSVAALERGLIANGVRDRCQIHFGDNRLMAPRAVANRVNLGLIPSSEDGWEPACRALDPATGGTMHVHGNVTSSSVTQAGQASRSASTSSSPPLSSVEWAETVKTNIRRILDTVTSSSWTVKVEHVERVKSYAPHVDHLVVDLKCIPTPK